MMRLINVSLAVVGVCAVVSAVSAQGFKNYGFNDKTSSQWTIANTANGVGAPGGVVFVDIDQFGPLGISQSLRFTAGRAAGTGAQEGVECTQSFALDNGVEYDVTFNWLAQNLTLGTVAEGGVFNIIKDGNIVATQAAGSLVSTQSVSGSIHYTVTGDGGSHTWGARITRPAKANFWVRQYVDDFKPEARPFYVLAASGNCPGTVVIAWSGVTPGADQKAYISPSIGTYTILAPPPLKGIRLNLMDDPVIPVPGFITDGGTGADQKAFTVNPTFCHWYVQFVDMATLQTSYVAQLP